MTATTADANIEPRVTKHSAEAYFVTRRLSDTSPYRIWATITLVPMTPGGLLQVHSDYGEWSYYWSHPGKDFKTFLAGLNDDYLLGKLCGSRPKQFNLDETVKRLRERMADHLKEGTTFRSHGKDVLFTEEVAEEAGEALEAIASEYGHSADLFVDRCLDAMPWLWEDVCDGLAVMEYDRQCREFVRLLWPVFVEELRRESASHRPAGELTEETQ